jgi:IPT/TIG domain
MTTPTVTIGGVPCTNVLVWSDTGISCTAPAGTAGGSGHLKVTTAVGTSAGSPADLFTYDGTPPPGIPTVTGLAPNHGPNATATAVTATGTNFTGTTGVKIGGVACTSVVVVNATTLTFVTPTLSGGPDDVIVTNAAGASIANPPGDSYTFDASSTVPTVTSLSVNTHGPEAGGTGVAINGTNLAFATAVHFGANSTPLTAYVSATALGVYSPAGTGIVDVTVTAPAGTSAVTAADKFTYDSPALPTITAVSPTSGTYAGGTAVTITGTNLATVLPADPTSVMFNAIPAASITVNSGTSITVHSPAGSGPVDITVKNAAGRSIVSLADQFTYTSPLPVEQFLAVSTGDGTVYTDFTNPINVRGTIGITWSATHPIGIQETWVEKIDGTVLATGLLGVGGYGNAYDTAGLPVGLTSIRAAAISLDGQRSVSPTIQLNVQPAAGTHGLFAKVFYTIYTIPNPNPPPTVTILTAVPNPIPAQ